MRTARITSLVLSAVLALPFVASLSACGGDDGQADAEPFDTLMDCFDEHHNQESLSINDALVVCCVDHPIAGVHPSCGDTHDACVAHVDQEITDATVTSADIDAACTDYIDKK